MDKLWFVKSYDFLRELDDSCRNDLIALGSQLQVSKDQLLFNAGSISDNVYILLEGRVKIFELTPEGREIILWFCFPGETFGMAEIVQRSRRTVYAQACTDVKVLRIEHDEFIRFLKQNPEVSLKVIELLSSRLRELGDIMSNLVSDDVRSRVFKLLTRLAARYGIETSQEVRLNISLTHQEMADMIGTTRQSVTTVLNSLKRENFLRVENKVIYLKNDAWAGMIAQYSHLTSIPA